MASNREYKDSVFTLLFKEPDKLRELYGALEGVTLPPDTPIEVKTLTDAVFKDQINDIAFLVDKRLVFLTEHQSTINPNMPMRLLMYAARVYEKILDRKTLYRSKLVQIPTPEFVVLYDGKEPYKDFEVLRLSDAFLEANDLKAIVSDKPALDLTVRVYNINDGKNPEMVRKSETLSGFSRFIAKTREFADAMPKDEQEAAFRKAIQYCIDHGILADFLQEHGSEVSNMLITEWNWDDYVDVQREEGREEGREEKAEEAVKNLLEYGMTPEQITKALKLPIETVQHLVSER